MAERFTTRIRTSMDKVLPLTKTVDGVMMIGDTKANEVIVELWKNGSQVVLTNASEYLVIGYVIMPNEQHTIRISGDITENGEARIIMPANAYSMVGVIKVIVQLCSDPSNAASNTGAGWNTKQVIASFKCKVENTSSGSYVDPEWGVMDIEQVLRYLDSIRQLEQSLNAWGSADATASSLSYGATQPTVNLTTVSGHKRFEFGLIPPKSVQQAYMTSDDKLRLTFTDGTSFTSPAPLTGQDGENAYGMGVVSYKANDKELTLDAYMNADGSEPLTHAEIDGIFSTM